VVGVGRDAAEIVAAEAASRASFSIELWAWALT
jgi:hypothetical protein